MLAWAASPVSVVPEELQNGQADATAGARRASASTADERRDIIAEHLRNVRQGRGVSGAWNRLREETPVPAEGIMSTDPDFGQGAGQGGRKLKGDCAGGPTAHRVRCGGASLAPITHEGLVPER